MSQSRRRTAERGAAAAFLSSKRACMEHDAAAEEEETSQFFTMDPDARSLDCLVCLMPYQAEIYQCKNGHAACARCCLRINRKCWCFRDEPIGDIRCRPLESLLADLNKPCKFFTYGCTESLKYTQRQAHEDVCSYAPFHCPFSADGCGYRGPFLHRHVVNDHTDTGEVAAVVRYLGTATVTVEKAAPFYVLVKAGRARRPARVFVLLNGGDVLGGRCLSLVCLGPRPEEDGDAAAEVKYKMQVHAGGGATTLEAVAPCVRDVEGFQAKVFVFVPEAHWGPDGTVSVSVRFR